MVNSAMTKGIPLWPGWNFISPQLQPQNIAIATVLAPILPKVLVVWGFNATTQQWPKYVPGGTSNTLTTIEGGKGYWIYATDHGFLSLAGGTAVSSPTYLAQGWNLVGYPGQSSIDVGSALTIEALAKIGPTPGR